MVMYLAQAAEKSIDLAGKTSILCWDPVDSVLGGRVVHFGKLLAFVPALAVVVGFACTSFRAATSLPVMDEVADG